MSESSNPNDYRVAQKVIHWLMGFFIVLDLFVAQKFGGELEMAERLQSRMDHSTLGTTLAILLLLRLYFRWRSGAPAIPGESEGGWQVMLAKITHCMLYVAMLCLLTTGALTATQATDPILIYNSLEITIGRMTDENFVFMRQFHELMTWAMIALIALHIAGALYHQFVMRDRVLVKMLKFWTSEQAAE